MFQQSPFRRLFFAIFAVAFLGACALGGPVREDKKANDYSISGLKAPWKKISEKADADHAWLNSESGAILALRSLCHRYEHISLRNLAQNLYTVLQDVEVIDTQSRSIASREAFESHVKGRIDGVDVESKIVVLRKNHCIFDFTVTEHKELSSHSTEALEKLVSSFKFSGGSAP